MSRTFSDPLHPMTPLVQTLWYRAPEVLLDSSGIYTSAIDIWSCGCVFAELLTINESQGTTPLFNGQGELQQLMQIFDLLGTPTEEEWPAWKNLTFTKTYTFKPIKPGKLRQKFPKHSYLSSQVTLSDAGYDLLCSMLRYSPQTRITAQEALQHPYFNEKPQMQSESYMPILKDARGTAGDNSSKNAAVV
jgi:cell division cycle 2-like protein